MNILRHGRGLRGHGRGRWSAALIVVTAACATLAVGLLSGRALADPARARAHFDLGKRYFEVDEYSKAIDEFKAAHVEEPDPAFLYNIAECYRHMGETKEALVFYRRFLLLSPPNAPTRASVEKRVAALQAAMKGAADVPLAPSAGPVASPAPAGAPAPKFASAPPAAAPTGAAPPEARAPEPTPAAAPGALALAAPAATAPAVDLRAQASPEPRADTSRPFYKSAWFYVVLGGALVAGTAGAFVLASGKGGSPPSTPLGNQPAFQ
jgi:tetratricopeptide (TPR) repeat protein